MLSFSPFFILIPFGLITAIIGFFGLINIAHLVRTGNTTLVSLFFTLLFLGYSFGVLFLTYNLVASYDWHLPVEINYNSFGFSSDSFTY